MWGHWWRLEAFNGSAVVRGEIKATNLGWWKWEWNWSHLFKSYKFDTWSSGEKHSIFIDFIIAFVLLSQMQPVRLCNNRDNATEIISLKQKLDHTAWFTFKDPFTNEWFICIVISLSLKTKYSYFNNPCSLYTSELNTLEMCHSDKFNLQRTFKLSWLYKCGPNGAQI